MSRRRAARELCVILPCILLDGMGHGPWGGGAVARWPTRNGTANHRLRARHRRPRHRPGVAIAARAKLLLPPRLCARRCDGSLVDTWNPSPLLASLRTTTGVPLVIDATQCCGYAVARRGGRPSPTMLRG